MIKNKTKSAPYYNIGQLRVDYWNKLKIETAELARCHKGSANEKRHKQATKELIKDLKGVECFFASPGIARIQRLEKAFSVHEHASLSHMAAETTKQLVGDSYRSNPDFLDHDEHS
ncbi:MAG: ornithine decarboxylase, partial [Eudoraea sp.]